MKKDMEEHAQEHVQNDMQIIRLLLRESARRNKIIWEWDDIARILGRYFEQSQLIQVLGDMPLYAYRIISEGAVMKIYEYAGVIFSAYLTITRCLRIELTGCLDCTVELSNDELEHVFVEVSRYLEPLARSEHVAYIRRCYLAIAGTVAKNAVRRIKRLDAVLHDVRLHDCETRQRRAKSRAKTALTAQAT